MLTHPIEEAVNALTVLAKERWPMDVSGASDALIATLDALDPDWSEISEEARLTLCGWIAEAIDRDNAVLMVDDIERRGLLVSPEEWVAMQSGEAAGSDDVGGENLRLIGAYHRVLRDFAPHEQVQIAFNLLSANLQPDANVLARARDAAGRS